MSESSLERKSMLSVEPVMFPPGGGGSPPGGLGVPPRVVVSPLVGRSVEIRHSSFLLFRSSPFPVESERIPCQVGLQNEPKQC